MSELLNKLSPYNLFNYLLPGVIFSATATQLTSYNFVHENLVIGFFIFYFIGLVISRIGSLIIEPLFKKMGFVKFADYKKYGQVVKIDPTIETLSEANNMYRTLSSTFLLLLTVRAIDNFPKCLTINQETGLLVIAVILFFLFSFSYRKQTNYITRRINNTIQ